ncbi:hypothetical protein [Streptomyces himalayensis]|uniref:Uncharacterized protein n=1 Tax=Streptomyces himalayensis subsp. himalayensis TaxID=2756131 RepID=A0A7W0DVF9_9ACTN|nr:hypothetical protein [Streptomyces himalayensis]MBA2951448.1 hypothetical protein [Streptomyces himalayensis subsp. himalayensis]
MADKEFFYVPGVGQFPNEETANDAAERHAAKADEEVEVCRCTETVIRRYRRNITVIAEDVTPA